MGTRDTDERRPDGVGSAWAVAFFVGYLFAQLAIPVYKLTEERPSQFGWQMYSGVRAIPEVAIVIFDSTVHLDTRQLLVSPRLDLDYSWKLAEHLCQNTLADTVRIRVAFPRSESEHACRR